MCVWCPGLPDGINLLLPDGSPPGWIGRVRRGRPIRRVAADGAVVLLISHDDDLLALATDRQLTPLPARAR